MKNDQIPDFNTNQPTIDVESSIPAQPNTPSPASQPGTEPAWEDFGFDREFLTMKEQKVGTVWVGWWVGTEHSPQYGDSYVFRRVDNNKKLVIPGRGQLKFIFEREFKKFDYIWIKYIGKDVLETGTWKGSLCYKFDVKKAIDWSGERTMHEKLGLPIPEHLKNQPVPTAPITQNETPVQTAPEPVVDQKFTDEISNVFN